LPTLPEVIDSQDALAVAIHPQPLLTVTATLPLPTVAATELLVGEIA